MVSGGYSASVELWVTHHSSLFVRLLLGLPEARWQRSPETLKFEQVNSILADINDGEDVPSSLTLSIVALLHRKTVYSSTDHGVGVSVDECSCGKLLTHYTVYHPFFSPRMVERCTTLTRVPPPQDWDGTWDSYSSYAAGPKEEGRITYRVGIMREPRDWCRLLGVWQGVFGPTHVMSCT